MRMHRCSVYTLTMMDTRYSAVCKISNQSMLTMGRDYVIIKAEVEGACAPSGFILRTI